MRNEVRQITHTGLMLAVIMAVQIVGLPNPLTGTAVNAILIFSLLHGNLKAALVLALLSPFGGVISGHLPVPLLPVLPVIILGNSLLLIVYNRIRERSRAARTFLPALMKGVLIGLVGHSVVKIFGLADAKWLLIPVLGLQFFTACGGIILAEEIHSRIFSGAAS